ncbi:MULTISPECIES: DegT/DnrJ/EryC1/StrS aminotransferase family protein [unclassified Flavobacterium]|uniref:DegT/DnrJ/EryC1/StrS family aminotransferase n=1 Tax=unclassified Flavobacterium TaxID=196869 RepID=UPI001F144A3C|nr:MULTISPECIES: aminotransferase class I/II-fold pyridoxal phosphate-dependent enzyme [unclassified Flavobacterium]UMY65821.1 aminotransferase class I/II-fold pyridoxal phosphate-dependent enzyme [Flavobacterium sp. HJ-32-4]
MSNSKIWLSSPHMGGSEQRFVNEAFASNWVAPLGPNVSGFEQDLKQYLSADIEVAALSSGTAALHLALVMLGVGAGDEVICQSFTFSASANPIAYLGATPVFVDSEEDTWNMDPELLREAIMDRMAKGKKPKAIIPVHLYGMPCKMDEIMAVANEYDIPVVEDAAEALGSRYKDRACGTFGHFAALSFNGNKIITTSGGGALVTRSMADKNKVVFLSTQARDDAPHYQHSEIGYNYRMSNICAGIGRGQMEVVDDRVQARRGMNAFYRSLFEDQAGISMQTEPDGDFFSNFWLTSILVDPSKTGGLDRESIRLSLADLDIETRPLWKPMHLQPVFASCPAYGGSVSESLFENGLCLPSGSNLGEFEKERIVAALAALGLQLSH